MDDKPDGLPSPPPYSYEAAAFSHHRRLGRPLVRRLLSTRALLRTVTAILLLLLCAQLGSLELLVARKGQPSAHDLHRFAQARAQCDAALRSPPPRVDAALRRHNPRWTPTNGQPRPVVVRNARLFDGEAFLPGLVDVAFSRGLIDSVANASLHLAAQQDAVEYDVQGRHVTPGLVDMHSHHLAGVWPTTTSTDDGNEMNEDTKAFTPMVRVLDSLKPYDAATELIMSGGVTSSLLIPGSANLMGGEGVPVKNVLYSGEHHEPVVADLLLERGVPAAERRRYMKMAFGENPKRVWGYTRMGNVWHLRQHMQRAQDLRDRQDDYCAALQQARGSRDRAKARFVRDHGTFPFDIALESTVGVLRGQVIVQNHNYEPQDLEGMLRVSREFGYTVAGFHHAIEAWQVPEMLKELAENVTIATFAEFSLYKWESFAPSLYAGHILNKHGVAVAYKSDHSGEFTNAKYLASQAAVAHSFLLPEDKALQSITSIPARAMDLDFRVGYCRPGYDADIVVWDSHPLSTGATPMQVFIDGQPQLDQKKVEESMGSNFTAPPPHDAAAWSPGPQVRSEPGSEARRAVCSKVAQGAQTFLITGITKAFVDNYPELVAAVDASSDEVLELVVDRGRVACLGPPAVCAERREVVRAASDAVEIHLQRGHVLPGLTAVTSNLGMREIAMLEETGDGDAAEQKIGDPDSVVYAKHGVWLDGKQFARARLGGVTRAISPPLTESSGLVHGVSVEVLTSGKKSLAQGGIVQGDVALHISLGDETMMSEGSVSRGVKNVRKMLGDGRGKNNATVFGRVAAGELPLVVSCDNKYDMEQVVLIKKDFPDTKVVILGGREAPYVADELAEARIPVILTGDRGAPATFRAKEAVVGPPLSRSVASYLTQAGVEFAIAIDSPGMPAQWRLHDVGPEAGWTAKYAGLDEKAAVDLVTRNVERILGLPPSRDLVVFEGDPLRYGASVVLGLHADRATGKLEAATCFPREDEFPRQQL